MISSSSSARWISPSSIAFHSLSWIDTGIWLSGHARSASSSPYWRKNTPASRRYWSPCPSLRFTSDACILARYVDEVAPHRTHLSQASTSSSATPGSGR